VNSLYNTAADIGVQPTFAATRLLATSSDNLALFAYDQEQKEGRDASSSAPLDKSIGL
jgi:hypothetical protein